MLFSVTVDAEIDPEDVLCQIDHEAIVKHLEDGGYYDKSPETLMDVDVMDYFHGDFDLKAFLRKIGLEEARKVLRELEEELI